MKKKIMYKILLSYLTITSLTVTTFLLRNTSMKPQAKVYAVEKENDLEYDVQLVNISESYINKQKNIKIIDSLDQLKTVFDKKITFNDLRNTLSENKHINDEYRKYTEEFIDLVSLNFPNVDLTIFNLNLKYFDIEEITIDEMQEENEKKQAFYRIEETKIYMHDEHSIEKNKKECYFHELWHMFNNLYLKIDDTIYYRNTTLFTKNGTPIDEGMTTYLTWQLCDNSNLNSYPHQYDEIKLLYEIYGYDLLNNYFNYGVEGIEKLIINDSNYSSASNLFKLMNNELKGSTDDSYQIYSILIELCNDETNYYNVSKILKNTGYSKAQKESILDLFYDSVYSIDFDDSTRVTFDNLSYYNINNLFYAELENDGNIYLINNEIMSNFFYTGYIHNVYDEESIYIGTDKLLMRESF